MKALTCLFSVLVLAAPLAAGPLTKGERERALSELYASRKQFLDSIAGLSAAQWNFKPAPEVWSVAECAEHIALSEDRLLGLVKKIAASPAVPGFKPQVADEAVLKGFRDRSRKAQAPEPLQPQHKWKTPEELTAHFRESRDLTLDYARDTQDELRGHVFKHPAFGDLDAYQWLLGIAAHSERHTEQIREVMANPKFPKR